MHTILRSTEDASVNFTTSDNGPGMIEARYVRRRPDYFIVYLSSQTGCAQACRMCHLTQSHQIHARDVTMSEFLGQADEVLGWYDTLAEPAKIVHFNFMARGEVFVNRLVLTRADDLIDELARRALARNLYPKFKFSTIMPSSLSDREVTDVFRYHQPDIYYSIYSTDPIFRRRWLPKALNVPTALRKLKAYQILTRKVIVLHWALIDGQNSDSTDVEAICDAVNGIGLRVDVNLVRYNPYSERLGQEPSEEVIKRNAHVLEERLPGARVKVVPRVGFDVKASCGTFLNA